MMFVNSVLAPLLKSVVHHSYVHTCAHNNHTFKDTHRCKEIKEEKHKGGKGSRVDWTSSAV